MHPISERPPTINFFRTCGLDPDPWQVEVLENKHQQMLLNCCRQAGKSAVGAMLGLAEAIWHPGTRVIVISASHRQSRELFGTMKHFYYLLKEPFKDRVTRDELEMKHFSRILCLPSREATIRGYSKVNFLIIDEAARGSDEVYRALRPTLAVSQGRIICLATPCGRGRLLRKGRAPGG